MGITLTPAAVEQVGSLVDKQFPYLRIGVRGGGCSGLQYAMNREDQFTSADKVFRYGEQATVIVDPVSMMYLDGMEIDFVSDLVSSGFKFNNPNVKTTCGCGKSFGA